MKRLILFCAVFVFALAEQVSAAPDILLDGPNGRLVWNHNGLAIHPKTLSPPVRGASRPVWALRLVRCSAQDPAKWQSVIIEDTFQEVSQKQTENGFELFYPQMVQGGKNFDISLRLTITRKEGAFRFGAELDNRTSDWTVMEITGPVLNEIELDLSKYPLLWPDGLGKKYASAPDTRSPGSWQRHHDNFQLVGTYPGVGFNMQFITFAGKEGGLYMGSPDSTREAKQFVAYYYTSTKRWKMAINHLCCLAPGKKWKRNLMDALPYAGSWHTAADFYRRESQNVFAGNLVKPDWVDMSTGMFLVIMNQQNNRHVMWTYDQIGGKMCDDAERQGFDMIGLFGWHKGGHDALYPEMTADPLLGGRDKLIQGIKEAQRRGKKVCLYANGQLIDYALKEFWQKEGEKLSFVQSNGKVRTETWTIYDDTDGHVFGRACLLSERWYDMMLELARDAQRLGANGILFDQVSVNPPQHCWSTDHGHDRPAMTHGVSGSVLMEKVEREMKKIDPDFIVLTEGFNDSAMDACAYFHSIGYGIYGTPSRRGLISERDHEPVNGPFRALFRYTWPEIAMTIRNPIPIQHPRFTNMACLLGLKNEVEIRFPTDVNVLKSEEIPAMEQYRNDHLSQSRINTLLLGEFKGVTGKDCFDYTQKVAQFRLKNASLLLKGRFVDEVGFTCQGKVWAKAFTAGKQFGVLVWNPDTEPVAFKIDVPDARFIRASSPDSDDIQNPQSELAPETIRLLVWEKR